MRWPYLNAFQYQFALDQAQAACRMPPKKGLYLTTLAAAQYRVGLYSEAAENLRRFDEPQLTANETPTPAKLAFLAMAYHQLGHEKQARDFLEKLRAEMNEGHRPKNEDAEHLGREATELIEKKRREPGEVRK